MEVEQSQQCPWTTQARALDLFPLVFAHIFPSRDFAHELPADSILGRPPLHPSRNKGTPERDKDRRGGNPAKPMQSHQLTLTGRCHCCLAA